MSSSPSPSSSIDASKKVYLIVHGQRQLLEPVKERLASAKQFRKENMELASLEKAGSEGEYVAMLWPPMAPSEIVVSQITMSSAATVAGISGSGEAGRGRGGGMGAWSSVGQKELFRIPLKS